MEPNHQKTRKLLSSVKKPIKVRRSIYSSLEVNWSFAFSHRHYINADVDLDSDAIALGFQPQISQSNFNSLKDPSTRLHLDQSERSLRRQDSCACVCGIGGPLETSGPIGCDECPASRRVMRVQSVGVCKVEA